MPELPQVTYIYIHVYMHTFTSRSKLFNMKSTIAVHKLSLLFLPAALVELLCSNLTLLKLAYANLRKCLIAEEWSTHKCL